MKALANGGAGVRLSVPVSAWLLLPVLTLWPIWLWGARRMGDGSDDPFGVVALLALFWLGWRDRHLLAAPCMGWLLASLAFSALALLSLGSLPALLCAVLAVMAVFFALLALRAPGQPVLGWLGLGLLALPVLASLQFFIGYPLRVLTAQASVWLLRAGGVDALRQGSSMEVAGQLVMVDAPCSGIQMAWVAYFSAFLAAAWRRLPDRLLLRRLPVLGGLVLAGNIVRNLLLVLLETGPLAGTPWLHEGIGLLVFIAVCLLVLRTVSRGGEVLAAVSPAAGAPLRPAVQAGVLGGFLLLGLVSQLPASHSTRETTAPFVEWPHSFAGQPLQPQALSPLEQRFAEDFPGVIARFSVGSQVLVLRHVRQPTRKLHPAADCYRGLGYRVSGEHLRRDGEGGLQRCFRASTATDALQVCEYIEDANGVRFSDTSAWYWAALAGESPGPWRAVTLAGRL